MEIESLGTLTSSRAELGGSVSSFGNLTISTNLLVGDSILLSTFPSYFSDGDIIVSNNAGIVLDSATDASVILDSSDDIIFATGSILTTGNNQHRVVLYAGVGFDDDIAAGSVTNTANGPETTITTNLLFVLAGDGIGDSSEAGIGANESLRINVDSIQAENLNNNDVSISELDDIRIVEIVNEGRHIELTAESHILDGDSAPDDLDILGDTVSLTSVNGSIGSAGSDILKGSFDSLEIEAATLLEANATNGLISFNALPNVAAANFTADSLVFFSTGDLNAATIFNTSSINVTNLSLIADSDNDGSGILTIGESVSVVGDLRIEGHEIVALDGLSNPTVANLSAKRLLISVDTSTQFSTNVQQLDIELDSAVDIGSQTNQQHLIIENLSSVELVDLNCDDHSILSTNDDVKIVANGDAAIQQQVEIGDATLLLDVSGDLAQTSIGVIQSHAVGLIVGGRSILNAENHVENFAANNNGLTVFNNFSDLRISDAVFAAETGHMMSVSGLTTIVDAKINTAGDLSIVNNVDTGVSNILLAASGMISQVAAGTVTANGLAIMAGDAVVLDANNSVNVFAAENSSVALFNNVGDLTIGTVTVAVESPHEMNVNGVSTNGNDFKSSVTGDLLIADEINTGSANTFFNVSGNVTQAAIGTVSASGLGLMVGGETILDAANAVHRFAANNGGSIVLNNDGDVAVSTVAVGVDTEFEMTVTGITTSNDDVKLTADSIGIVESIRLGDGTQFIVANGNVSQTAAGTITANNLGMIVDGTSILNSNNNVNSIAAENSSLTVFNNLGSLNVDAVSVFEGTTFAMALAGITIDSGDLKLNVSGDLNFNGAISIDTGNAFFNVDGNVAQAATGVIQANELGLMVTGDTSLAASNNVSVFAANNKGTLVFNDANTFTVGNAAAANGTAFEMSVAGVSTDNHDAKLSAGGDFILTNPIDVGNANAFIVANGSLSQSSTATVFANGLGLMVGGTTILDADNSVSVFAALNVGDTLLNNQLALKVGSVTVAQSTTFEMSAIGITTANSDVQLNIHGDLTVENAIDTGIGNSHVFVDGNLKQESQGTISTQGLGLMVTGRTVLDTANQIQTIATDNQSTIVLNSEVDIEVGAVTTFSGTEFESQISGITTPGKDVKLVTAGSLSIAQAINVGNANLFLDVGMNTTQSNIGAIQAQGLGTMSGGSTVLDAANQVQLFAADNANEIVFRSLDDLTVGAVTAMAGTEFAMTVAGVTTNNSEVKLITDKDFAIAQAIDSGNANTFLTASGEISQSDIGTITVAGLGIMAGDTTVLDSNNEIQIFAADADATIILNTTNDLAVGTVSVQSGEIHEMSVSGIATNNADVKLTTVTNLLLDDAINIGNANLLLSAGGTLSQTVADVDGLDGTISAQGLVIMVDGETNLINEDNHFSVFAAATIGSIDIANSLNLTIGAISVDSMEVLGLKTQANLTLTNLGNLEQSSAVVVSGTTDLNTTGFVCLTGADCDEDGINDNDFVGQINVLAGSHIEIADTNDLTVGNLLTDTQIFIRSGAGETGSLTINGTLATVSNNGQILFQSDSGITQNELTSTIFTNSLMIGSSANQDANTGQVQLNGNNVVEQLSASLNDDLQFTNRNDLQFSPATYQSACSDFNETFVGLVANSATLNVTSETTGGNLTDSVDTVTRIQSTLIMNVAGNIELGDGNATLEFTDQVIDNLLGQNATNDFVQISAAGNGANEDGSDITATQNVSLFVDSSIILAEINVAESLFIDTIEGTPLNGSAGDILQTQLNESEASQISADTAAFVSNASVQLTNTKFNEVAIEANLNYSQLINAFQINENIGSTFTGSIDADVFTDAGAEQFLLNGQDAVSGVFDVESGFQNDGFFAGNNQFVNDLRVGSIIVNCKSLDVVAFETLSLSPIQLENVGNPTAAITSLGDNYIETADGFDLSVHANVDVSSIFSNTTLVAGHDLALANGAEIRRLDAANVIGLVNSLNGQFPNDHFVLNNPRSVIEAPGNEAFSDLNAQLDTAIGYQLYDFFFGNPGEQSFNLILGWFVADVSASEAISSTFQPSLLQSNMDVTTEFLLSEFSNFGQNISVYSLQISSIIEGQSPALTLSNITQFEQSFFAEKSFQLSQVFVTNDARINLFQNNGTSDLNFTQEILPTRTVVQNPDAIVVARPSLEVPEQAGTAPDPVFNFVNLIQEPEARPIPTDQQPESFFQVKFTADDDGIFEQSFKWQDPNDDPDAIRAAIESATLIDNDDAWPDTSDKEDGNWTTRIKDGKKIKPGLYFIFEVQEGQPIPEPVDAPVDRTDIQNLVEPDDFDSASQWHSNQLRSTFGEITSTDLPQHTPAAASELSDDKSETPAVSQHRFSETTRNALLGSSLVLAQCLINKRWTATATEATDNLEAIPDFKNVFSRASRFARKTRHQNFKQT